jgi:hypothetical protein
MTFSNGAGWLPFQVRRSQPAGVLRATLLFCLLSALLGIQSASTSACCTQAFQWKMKVGDQFKVAFEQSTDTTTTVTEKTTVITSKMEMEMAWKVVSADESGPYRIEQTIQSVRLSVGDPARPESQISFDTGDRSTATGPSRTLLDQIQPLLGLKFLVAMKPSGEIVDLELPEETADALRELPGSLPLQNLFSEAGMREMLGPSVVAFPEEKIEVGHRWSQEAKVTTAFGDYNRLRTFLYAGTGESDDLARFEITTSLSPLRSGPANNGSLLKYEESGELVFDTGNGRVSSFETEGTTNTELPYREKFIKTRLKNELKMFLEKQ